MPTERRPATFTSPCLRALRVVLASTLASVLLCTGPALQAADSPEAKAKAAELDKLRGEIKTLRKAIDSARGEQSQLQDQLKDSEQAIGRVAAALARIDADINALQARIDSLQDDRRGHLADIDAQRKELAQLVRTAYTLGRQEKVRLLLSQEDPGGVARALTYYDYLNRKRVERIEAMTQALASLTAVETDLAREGDALLALRQQQLAEEQALVQTREERAAALAALEKDMRAQGDRLAAMQRDEQALEALLKRLRTAVEAFGPVDGERKPFAKLKGALRYPAQGPVKASAAPLRGVFIDAPRGSEVRAISHGRVVFADWLRGFGQLLIIDHGGGYMSLYGHNQSLLRELGESVAPGDVIASVGDSGGQLHPGLYFEIRHQGQPVNPQTWCRRGESGQRAQNR